MRIPSSAQQQGVDAQPAAQGKACSTFDGDEDFALGWECANPALQIEQWKEETAAEPPCEAY